MNIKKITYLIAVLISVNISALFAGETSIAGNYKSFEGITSYNITLKNKYVTYDKFVSSSVFYEALEANYNYSSILFFGRLSENSKSLSKIEQTFSAGYQLNNYCKLFAGVREDYFGNSILLRPACQYKYKNIIANAAFIKTDNINMLTVKLKYSLNHMLYISYKYQLYDAFKNDALSWNASITSVGINF